MEDIKKIPALRFPEFSGEWEVKKFGDTATFSKGKGISKADIVEDGNLECIRYGELYTVYGETIKNVKSKTNLKKSGLVLSKSNDVIIPASGETQLDIATASCVLKDNIALGGDLNIIRTELNGVFLSYYLNNKKRHNIASLSQGVSVVHLYSSQLKLLELNIALLPEQQKISDFLTKIDTKIEQLTKKKQLLESYKKGVMQKIFSQELRFKDDEGEDYPDWEEKRLGEICNIKRGASPRPIADSKWFDENSNIGWVRISDVTKSKKYLNKTTQYLSNEGVKKSRLIEKGSLIMGICATIGKPIYTNFTVCIHDGFVVFDKLSENKEFIYYYLDMIKKTWYKYGQPGIQVNLNSNIVSSEKINLPSIPEQTKIANFLTKIDNKINLVEKQLTDSKQYKKSLLQQMFV
jgi:type I restriction enzyme S subunit